MGVINIFSSFSYGPLGPPQHLASGSPLLSRAFIVATRHGRLSLWCLSTSSALWPPQPPPSAADRHPPGGTPHHHPFATSSINAMCPWENKNKHWQGFSKGGVNSVFCRGLNHTQREPVLKNNFLLV